MRIARAKRRNVLFLVVIVAVAVLVLGACARFARPNRPDESPGEELPAAIETPTLAPEGTAPEAETPQSQPEAAEPEANNGEPEPGEGSAGTAAEQIDCAELGTTYTGGAAVAREDGTGYDISGCERPVPLLEAEMVKPAERDPSRYEEARCNDGTPFGFAVSPSPSGESKEWVIYLQGGGICDDNVIPCRGRGNSSSPPEADGEKMQIKPGGIFNRDPNANPTFHDANVTFGFYCSSDAWSGATTERRPATADPEGWYFSGRANVNAMVEILIERYGLDDSDPATKVLFAGSSAGATGVEANADRLMEFLPNTTAEDRLKLVNDAGFEIDFDMPSYRPGEASVPVREVAINAYDFWGSQFNPICEEAQKAAGRHPGLCFLDPINYPFIAQEPPNGLGLPYLIQTSQIDQYHLDQHGMTNPERDRDAILAWRDKLLEGIQNIEWLFSGGDYPYHTLITRDDGRDGWNIGPEGSTFRELLTRFWEGGEPEQVIFGEPLD